MEMRCAMNMASETAGLKCAPLMSWKMYAVIAVAVERLMLQIYRDDGGLRAKKKTIEKMKTCECEVNIIVK